jgi:hypothetical protein
VPLTRPDGGDPTPFGELMTAVEHLAGQSAFTLGSEGSTTAARTAIGAHGGSPAWPVARRLGRVTARPATARCASASACTRATNFASNGYLLISFLR